MDSSVSLPASFSLRAPTEDDIGEIIELVAAFDSAHYGRADRFSRDDILGDWARLNRETDAWVLLAPDGRIAGYGTLTDDSYGHLTGDGYAHPDAWGQGVGAALIGLMEARANGLIGNAPEEARVTLSNNVIASDDAACRLLESRGYTLIRRFWQMEITLDAPPLTPEWPEGITLRPFDLEREARAVFDAVEEAFQDHWGHAPRNFEQWSARMRREDFDPALWFIARAGADGEIAGVALCGHRGEELAWVNTLAVRRPWRRAGLGMALLLHAFGAFYRRGERRIGLGVDAESLTGATRLYERAGMRPVVRIATFAKELRAGKELSAQTLK